MKQFEKWSNYKPIRALQNSSRIYGYIEEQREDAWKAALEWVLSTKITSDSCVELDMLRHKIEEELEDA